MNKEDIIKKIKEDTGCDEHEAESIFERALDDGIVKRHLNPDDYVYYVIDVNGTEPDAEFNDREDAKDYVEKYKEFHTYRIVKAQHYTNQN